MANISATTPVVTPAVNSVTYDKWFVTQIVGKFGPTSGPTNITLQRASETDGVWTLMPNSNPNATVSFNLDIMKEIAGGNAALGTAFEAVVTAIDAYAATKKLL